MPRRLTRRSAGESVVARAQRLSDDLLAEEEGCFTRVWDAFDAVVDTAGSLFAEAWAVNGEDPARLRNDDEFAVVLSDLHTIAIEASMDAVGDMADVARDLSVESIRDELTLCERTLATPYAGLAEVSVTAAADQIDALHVDRLVAFADTTLYTQQTFAEAVQEQLRFAVLYKEPQEKVASRLFNPKPANLKGCSGRGMWWRSTSDLNASARDVSIRLSTQVRVAAMSTFNRVGEGRG